MRYRNILFVLLLAGCKKSSPPTQPNQPVSAVVDVTIQDTSAARLNPPTIDARSSASDVVATAVDVTTVPRVIQSDSGIVAVDAGVIAQDASQTALQEAQQLYRQQEGTQVLHAARWSGRGEREYVGVLLSRRTDASAAFEFNYFEHGEETAPDTSRGFPLRGAGENFSSMVAEVSNLGTTQFVLFGRVTGENPRNAVWVFDIPSDNVELLELETAALDGCRSEADVRARMPLSQGLRLEAIGDTTAVSLTGRLVFSTREQFNAIIAADGVQTCNVVEFSGRPRREQCSTYRAERITEEAYRSNIRPFLDGAFREGTVVSGTTPNEFCSITNTERRELRFDWTGTGPARRLTKISRIHLPSV